MYTPTSWSTETVATTSRLRNLETQHELALVDARVANNPLIVQVSSSEPAGSTGIIYLNTDDNKLYGYNGTAYVMLGVTT